MAQIPLRGQVNSTLYHRYRDQCIIKVSESPVDSKLFQTISSKAALNKKIKKTLTLARCIFQKNVS
ncbi:hypothetical protein EG028_20435 [Chitinophaga barathri]|uniref:Uncharacterized protein n=1 Tax=Chitinophaga barathri TaxID=1647451 RepID=A0A3N4M820_9BACT|nr:hypothetical protein EG028_20435 [Chitinophaga barathri]